MTIESGAKKTPSGSEKLVQKNNIQSSDNQLKTWIVSHIAQSIETQGLSQTKAAGVMGLKQPDLSALLNGKLSGYSAERLARCLSALGRDVKLVVIGNDGSHDTFVLGDCG